MTVSIKDLDECKSSATEKHSLSGGTASANFGKKPTSQSGSSARAVPLGVSHFSSALSRILFKYDVISFDIHIAAVTLGVELLLKRSLFT